MIALPNLRPLDPANCWGVDTVVRPGYRNSEFFDGARINDLGTSAETIDSYAARIINRFTGWLTGDAEFEFNEMYFLEGLARYVSLKQKDMLLDEAEQATHEELWKKADVKGLPKAEAEEFRSRILGRANGFIRANRVHLAAILIPEGSLISFGRYEDTHGISPGRVGAKLHRLEYDPLSNPAKPVVAHVLRGKDSSIGLVPEGYEVAKIGWVKPSRGVPDISRVQLDTLPYTHVVKGGIETVAAA